MIGTRSSIVTTEAVLWEWLNGFSDASTRGVAVEGYRRAHVDARIEVVPFQSELIDSAVKLYHLTEALTTDGHFEQAGLRVLMLARPPLRA